MVMSGMLTWRGHCTPSLILRRRGRLLSSQDSVVPGGFFHWQASYPFLPSSNIADGCLASVVDPTTQSSENISFLPTPLKQIHHQHTTYPSTLTDTLPEWFSSPNHYYCFSSLRPAWQPLSSRPLQSVNGTAGVKTTSLLVQADMWDPDVDARAPIRNPQSEKPVHSSRTHDPANTADLYFLNNRTFQ
ncbi:hypothetical protein Pst134EA_013396 [Puccinia striiformis f. sp. tritici]|uniref:hypothetical protein n=1 Tax=Puccinia striiformis f. sp. tritici TaxID=168172 RepID=UPI002008A722|nr:hypothetical protein Pst134EA_013396 [Puccinia striiformis f. sp. tritici]KAH9465513.1 hypothetical protein Pst134EA_013396 [Puccinia striiformis f. sp. tritici]